MDEKTEKIMVISFDSLLLADLPPKVLTAWYFY